MKINSTDSKVKGVPDYVLKAAHEAAVLAHNVADVHEVIFAHAGLLGDFLLFLRHGDRYLVVSVALAPMQHSLSGLNVKRHWQGSVLTTYTPTPGSNN